MSLEPGARLGSYEVTAKLGQGGMGEVYQATDVRLHRTVAIKVLPDPVASDPGQRRRLAREARAVAALNHPHICTLYDIGSEDGVDFLVMEHLEGETLANRLGRGLLPTDVALQYASEIADALTMAHEQGVIHRDIKPSNILITSRGQLKVLDFGIAKFVPRHQADDTGSGTASTVGVFGTASYMSPEQVQQGTVDARSDLFSLGTVLYECLTGNRAFHGPNALDTCGKIVHLDPTPPSQLNPMLTAEHDHLCEQLLAKNPDHRLQSAAQARELLRSAHRDFLRASESDTADVLPASLQPRRSADDGPFDVFLSYAREDRELALRLARLLEAEGWSVWWDHRLHPGETWSDVIETRLMAARCVVVLWSQHALRSEYLRDEASEGRRRGVLVPAVVADVMQPLGFRQVQTADLHDWKGKKDHEGYESLVGAIEVLVPRSAAANETAPAANAARESRHPTGHTHPLVLAARRKPGTIAASVVLATVVAIYAALQLSSPRLPEAPPEARALFDRGVEQIHQASYSSAALALEQAIEIHDEYPLAHARLAEARAQLDEQDRALNSLLRAATLVPDRSMLTETESLSLDAISGMVTRNFADAIESYTALVQLAPERAESHFELGRAFESDDQLPPALAAYQASIDLDSDYPPAFLRRGILLGRQNEIDSATSSLDNAELLYRTAGNLEGRIEAIYQRGVVFNASGRRDQAQADLGQATTLASANEQPDQQVRALAQLSRVLRGGGDFEAAESHLRQALQLASGRPQLEAGILIDFGNLYMVQFEYDEAEEYFTQGLEVADRFSALRTKARAQLSLASSARTQGKVDDVERLTTEALPFYRDGNYHRETMQALSFLSFAMNRRGELQGAEASYLEQRELATRLDNQRQLALIGAGLADVYLRGGHFPAALREASESRKVYEELASPRSVAFAIRDMARALALLGRNDDADLLLEELSSKEEFIPLRTTLRISSQLIKAQLELNSGEFSSAAKSARAVIQDRDTSEWSRINGLGIQAIAQSLAGRLDSGISSSGEALDRARLFGDPILTTEAELWYAMTRLVGGLPSEAISAARDALVGANSANNTEQAWRAAAVISMAGLARVDGVNEQSVSNDETAAIDRLSNEWGADWLDHYLERADVSLLGPMIR